MDWIFTRLQTGLCSIFVYLVTFLVISHWVSWTILSYFMAYWVSFFPFSTSSVWFYAPSIFCCFNTCNDPAPFSSAWRSTGLSGTKMKSRRILALLSFLVLLFSPSLGARTLQQHVRMRIPGCFLWLFFGIVRFPSHASQNLIKKG